jgi:hypothetical protein
MKLTATISYGEHDWQTGISVTGTKHQIVEHLFWLARTTDTEAPADTEYTLTDDSEDPYNPALTIRSSDSLGERDFVVLAFLIPAVEL